jgi:hypothetical protein
MDSGFANPPPIDIYEWQADEWETLDDIKLGPNTITNAENHVSPDGLVRFRLSIDNRNFQGGTCYYTALGLSGSR